MMSLEECYTMLHGNYQDAKIRLMNDRLVGKFIVRYLDDPTMQQLLDAAEAGDRTSAFRAAHTLKGVAANLAFTELQAAASALTEQLRPLDADPDQALLDAVKQAYQRVTQAIRQYSHSAE